MGGWVLVQFLLLEKDGALAQLAHFPDSPEWMLRIILGKFYLLHQTVTRVLKLSVFNEIHFLYTCGKPKNISTNNLSQTLLEWFSIPKILFLSYFHWEICFPITSNVIFTFYLFTLLLLDKSWYWIWWYYSNLCVCSHLSCPLGRHYRVRLVFGVRWGGFE